MNRTINLTFTRLFFSLFSFLFSISINAQQSGADAFAPYQVILRFDEGTTPAEQADILNQYNLEVVDGPTPISRFLLCELMNHDFPILPPGAYSNSPDSINGVIVTIDDDESDVDGIGNQFDGGFPAFNDGKYTGGGVPDLLGNCSGSFSIDISDVGTRQVSVAINDSGISGDVDRYGNFSLDHPNLFDPYFSPDNYGMDFVGDNLLPFPEDGNGHGTHMTSLLVGKKTPNTGQNYIPDLKLLAYRTHDDGGAGSTFDIIQGVDQAVIEQVEVMNMSFSYTASHAHRFIDAPLKMAMLEAAKYQNILFVCAAGNKAQNNDNSNGMASYPASFENDNIISVTSVDCKLDVSSWASLGASSVDVAAYGEEIPGAWLDGDYYIMSGTSPAAAMVTRVANMLAAHQTTFDYRPIKCAIIEGAAFSSSLSGKVVANGYLDAEGAYTYFTNNSNSDCPGAGGGQTNGGSGNAQLREGLAKGEQSLDLNLEAWTGDDRVDVYFNAQEGQIAQIMIFNLYGQIIHSDKLTTTAGNNQYSWTKATSNQSEFYMIQLMLGQQKETLKIVR